MRRLVALALFCGVAAPARASTFDVFGFHPRGVALGGAMAAPVDDYTATYYNPAALTTIRQVNLGFGFGVTHPGLYVDRGDAASEKTTRLPDTHLGITLGLNYPLGGIFEDKLAVALCAYLPVGKIIRVQGVDPQSPQFYLYQNLEDKLVVALAVAYEPLPWLSLGVGASVLADMTGRAVLALDILNQTFDSAEVAVELKPTASVNAGIHLRPADGLRIGLTYRGASSLSFALPVEVSEGELLALTLQVSQTVLWTPHQVSLGLSYELPDPHLLLSAEATLAFWSQAPDPSPHISVDLGGKLLDGVGLGGALDVGTADAPIDLGFVDTVTTRLGVEWEPLYWLRLRGGYAYRPTPAPRASGPYAYLDADAHLLSLGLGFVFKDPLELAPSPVEVDLSAQASVLPRRTVYRTDAQDPVGDLSYGGVMWAFHAAVSHRY